MHSEESVNAIYLSVMSAFKCTAEHVLWEEVQQTGDISSVQCDPVGFMLQIDRRIASERHRDIVTNGRRHTLRRVSQYGRQVTAILHARHHLWVVKERGFVFPISHLVQGHGQCQSTRDQMNGY